VAQVRVRLLNSLSANLGFSVLRREAGWTFLWACQYDSQFWELLRSRSTFVSTPFVTGEHQGGGNGCTDESRLAAGLVGATESIQECLSSLASLRQFAFRITR